MRIDLKINCKTVIWMKSSYNNINIITGLGGLQVLIFILIIYYAFNYELN